MLQYAVYSREKNKKSARLVKVVEASTEIKAINLVCHEFPALKRNRLQVQRVKSGIEQQASDALKEAE